MCTAISFKTESHYFGRNLDLEYSYEERVTITPRNYPFKFRRIRVMESHFAIIGMAYNMDGYPFYYDGMNEHGLAMAGLNFPGNAYYGCEMIGKQNIAPFELIPLVLGSCKNLAEARELAENINLIDINFSEELPNTPLHWMISDKTGSMVIESTREGLQLYDNPVGVLTNNPEFDKQLFNLNNYIRLSPYQPENSFARGLTLLTYSNGMGTMGLPGDFSSQSRFVKAAYVTLNSICESNEEASVSQFFHILSSVEQPRGSVHVSDGRFELTSYSCCCNTDKGIYYYRTYENSRITAVDMNKEALNGSKIVSYKLRNKLDVHFEIQD